MTSDENLVAQVAKDLLDGNASISPFAQVAIGNDTESLALPGIVVTAKLEEDEPGSPLPKRYSLQCEVRSINRPGEAIVMDDIYRQIRETLCPDANGAFPTVPVSISDNFRYYRIENASSSDHGVNGDTTTRSRTFSVFAQLL